MAEAVAIPQKPAQGTISADGTLAVYEPGSGKLLGEVRVSTPPEIRQAVQHARAAQAEWARKSFAQRREVILRFKDLVLARAEELCDHLSARGVTREWHPERLIVRDELPRSSGGKVAKGVLRQEMRDWSELVERS